jgi:hypothetical protein
MNLEVSGAYLENCRDFGKKDFQFGAKGGLKLLN